MVKNYLYPDDDPDSFGVTRVSRSCGTNHSIPNLPRGFIRAEAAYVEGNLYICGGYNEVWKRTICKEIIMISKMKINTTF